MAEGNSNQLLDTIHKGAITLALLLGAVFFLSMGAHLHPLLELLSEFSIIYLVAAIVLGFALAAFREWTLVALCVFIIGMNVPMQPDSEPPPGDAEQAEQVEEQNN